MQFVGKLSEATLNKAYEFICCCDFGADNSEDVNSKCKEIRAKSESLAVYARRAIFSYWFYVDDRIDWRSSGSSLLQQRVNKKSEKIDRYKENCGLCDFSLLVYTNQFYASGLLSIDSEFILEKNGFDKVYLFQQPTGFRSF